MYVSHPWMHIYIHIKGEREREREEAARNAIYFAYIVLAHTHAFVNVDACMHIQQASH
jgi:hypothetical protein